MAIRVGVGRLRRVRKKSVKMEHEKKRRSEGRKGEKVLTPFRPLHHTRNGHWPKVAPAATGERKSGQL